MKLLKRIQKKLDAEKRRANKRRIIRDGLKAIAPDLVVKHGPFKGMKYSEAKSVGSSFLPKLIGSYEAELHPTIEVVCQNNYSDIIDIGCAEGYYAVGLAMRFPDAKIHAFDTDEEAIRLCQEMAALNGVDRERFLIGDFCDTQKLLNISIQGKGLIICDCEGYEKELFTPRAAEKLAQHDLIIETHDCFDIEISTYLYNIFIKTHDIEVIQSIDDIQKAKTYQYDEIAGYDLATKKVLLMEDRASIMEWFFVKSRAA